MQKRYAAIDVGTNTILMVIASIDDEGNYKVIEDYHSIARLGEKLAESGRIQPEAIERAEKILHSYRLHCEEHGVGKIGICATSAMREAENAARVKENLEHTIGAEIELISGEKEAELSFLGTIDNYESNIVIDIGGGSTEIIYGHSGEYKLRRSFETGAVKLTEKFLPDHSPDHETVEEMRQYINKCFSGFDFDQLQGNLYAVAGTPTTVASVALGLRDFEREKIEGYVLEESELIKIIQLFLNSTIEEIVEKYGVHPRRADVITAGSIILHRIMKLAGRTSLIVSARGLRYGILKTMI